MNNNIDSFKNFVKEHPTLINYVKNNEMTWQKFYEMYDLYGTDDKVWNPYLTVKTESKDGVNNKTDNNNTKAFNEVLNMFKGLDANKVQSGISSLQKALGLVGDLFFKGKGNTPTAGYQPRPMYQHLDD